MTVADIYGRIGAITGDKGSALSSGVNGVMVVRNTVDCKQSSSATLNSASGTAYISGLKMCTDRPKFEDELVPVRSRTDSGLWTTVQIWFCYSCSRSLAAAALFSNLFMSSFVHTCKQKRKCDDGLPPNRILSFSTIPRLVALLFDDASICTGRAANLKQQICAQVEKIFVGVLALRKVQVQL